MTEVTTLDPELAAFVQGAVGIVVASRDATLLPSVGRAVGCRIDPDRRALTILLAASQNAALLDDIRRHRTIAVVFSEPSSHRTVQLKGRDATECAPVDEDLRAVAAYVEAFDAELARVGFGEGYARALLAHQPGDLVAVRFSAGQGFLQTPGPRAGEPLGTQ